MAGGVKAAPRPPLHQRKRKGPLTFVGLLAIKMAEKRDKRRRRQEEILAGTWRGGNNRL